MKSEGQHLSYKHTGIQMPAEEIEILKAGLLEHVSSVSDLYIMGDGVGVGRGVILKGRLEGCEYSCNCQYTQRTSIGRGEGHCEERQPPVVCDVSSAAKNSTREKPQGVVTGLK